MWNVDSLEATHCAFGYMNAWKYMCTNITSRLSISPLNS